MSGLRIPRRGNMAPALPPADNEADARAGAPRSGGVVYSEPRIVRFLLIGIAVAFIGILVIVPIVNILVEAFADGWNPYIDAIRDKNTLAALKLTLKVAAVAVPLNAIFGLAAAWAIGKFDFRGKSILVTLIDLPLAVSPVVAGLVFIVIFGRSGYLGSWFIDHDLKVVFAFPGITLATIFVTFPLVARSLIPIIQETGREAEEAATSLGSSGLRTFFQVTLPNIKWGLLNGIILCNARAVGEFGAVSVVSGKITGKTDTLPLRIEKLDKSYETQQAFAIASLLVSLALVTLVIKAIIEWRTGRKSL